MAKKQLKTVKLSDLEKSYNSPSALTVDSTPVEVIATVTMAPPEAPAPKPVKRKLTAEEKAYHEERWQAVHEILKAGIAELEAEGPAALKEEQRLADLKTFHEASYAPVQDYWTKKLKEVAEEVAKREADRLADLAAREAALRARKSRQADHRATRAAESQARAGKGSGGNGNGKKGGKGK